MKLSDTRIVLGSQSPRRLEILQNAGFDVAVIVSDVEEIFPEDMPIADVPEFLAKLKLKSILSKNSIQNALVICADTIVVFDNKIIGKPKNTEEAFSILKKLNGNKHQVITGVSMYKNNKLYSFSEIAFVYFKTLTDDEILHYINNYTTLDKAGAYNIQEYNGIDNIEGEFENVMGLPIKRILFEIENW